MGSEIGYEVYDSKSATFVEGEFVERRELGGTREATDTSVCSLISMGDLRAISLEWQDVPFRGGDERRLSTSHGQPWAIAFALSFRPYVGESFLRAAVAGRCWYVSPTGSGPTVELLVPEREVLPRKISSATGLNAKVNDVGFDSKRSVEREHAQDYIVAYGKYESEFEWRLSRIAERQLDGIQVFVAYLRDTLYRPFSFELEISATIRREGILRRGTYQFPAARRVMRVS